MKSTRIASALRLSLVFSCIGAAQAAIVPPSVMPAAVTAGTQTQIVVSALITSTRPAVLANEVKVLQVDENGDNARVLGSLNDEGRNGDSIAGDGIFGGAITLNEATPGRTYIQISASLKGTPARILSPITAVLVTPAGVPNAPQPSSTLTTIDPQSGATVVCNELLASFKPRTSEESIESAISSIGGRLSGTLADLGVYQITLPSCDGTSLDSAEAVLKVNSVIDYVEPNGVGVITQNSSNATDPYLSETRGLQWPLATINAPQAWSLATEVAGVKNGATIAIIDSGINANHEDLSGQVIPGINWCPSVVSDNCIADVAADTNDDIGHGTMVAGIAAAITNNNLGVASPAYRARVIAEKVNFPGSGTVSVDATAYAISHAVSLGARVINISLAFSRDSETMRQAIAKATARGVVIVASAGNYGDSTKVYPAGYSLTTPVISVAASDQNNQWARWSRAGVPWSSNTRCSANLSASNYGSWVSVYAPGSAIFGLLYNQNGGPDGYGYLDSLGILAAGCGGDGTSFSAPFVAGSASLLLAVNPNLLPAQIKQVITASATPTGNTDPAGNPITLLNEYAAVKSAWEANQIDATTPTVVPTQNASVSTTSLAYAEIPIGPANASSASANKSENAMTPTLTKQAGLPVQPTSNDTSVTGNLILPNSTSTAGVIYQNNNVRVFHTYSDYTNTDTLCTAYGALSCNVFVGALSGNLTMGPQGGDPKLGNHNSAVGFQSLNANTTGWDNVALGDTALTFNTSGFYNSAVGAGACEHTTTGIMNTCIGASALLTATTANYNIAVGTASAYQLSSGTENVMIGYESGYHATTGSRNIFIGSGTDYYLTTGVNNIAIGEYALDDNVSGSSNIALGSYAGKNQTGSNVLIIDNQNRANSAAESANAIVYGTMAPNSTSQSLNVNAGTINLNGNVTVGTTSSTTLKLLGASCLEMSNSDGSGTVNYITVLNGVLSATTTKPSNCK
jgi:thermitase